MPWFRFFFNYLLQLPHDQKKVNSFETIVSTTQSSINVCLKILPWFLEHPLPLLCFGTARLWTRETYAMKSGPINRSNVDRIKNMFQIEFKWVLFVTIALYVMNIYNYTKDFSPAHNLIFWGVSCALWFTQKIKKLICQ